jgi:hypothetical protein
MAAWQKTTILKQNGRMAAEGQHRFVVCHYLREALAELVAMPSQIRRCFA